MGNDTLELFSFQVDEQALEGEVFYTVEMPVEWQNYFHSKLKDQSYAMTIKPAQMEASIYSLFSHVFYISWKTNPWLLTSEEIDLALLKEVCLSWFAKQENCAFNELSENLVQVKLRQKQTTFGEIKSQLTETNIMYRWIPSLMAKRVERTYEGEHISFIQDRKIQFHHICLNGQHECMSSLIQVSEKQDPFAYVIRFELKTRGLQPEAYVVNVSFHIRRFLTKSLEDFKGVNWYRKGSILASLPNPFHQHDKRQYIALKFQQNQFGLQWASAVDQLFSEFLIDRVNPEQILQNVEHYLHSEAIQFLVVYSDQTFNWKAKAPDVLPGVGLVERTGLFEDMKALFPEFTPIHILPSVKQKVFLGSSIEPIMHYGDVDDIIQLEIWGSKTLFDAVKESLIEKYGLLTKTKEESRYLLNDNRETIIELVHLDHSEIIAAMPANQQNREEKRIQEIERLAPRKARITMAMVEIQHVKKYSPRITDPKNAVRQGLGRRNRLTQFIYPMTEKKLTSSDKSRIKSGFKDLLTDYGYLPNVAQKLEREDVFMSVDLLRMKKGSKRIYIPMITKWVDRQLYIKFLGDVTWQLFSEALVGVTQREISFITNTNQDVKRFHSFLKRAINEELKRADCRLTVIVDAALRYDHWLPIKNDELLSNELPFRKVSEEWKNRVRVVRVNHTNDNPQYQILKKGERVPNRNKGLFYDEHGIYYSVGSRPDTIQSPKYILKYESPNWFVTRQNVVELIPLGVTNEEEAKDLAEYVFHLRHLIIGYGSHTIQPYPLHVGEKMRKYLEKANIKAYDDWRRQSVDSIVIEDE